MQRWILFASLFLGVAAPASAQEWQAVTEAIIAAEKPGYGKLCGVVVDHATGHLIINLSDKGLYRSADRSTLLVLDNFEHLMAAAGDVAAILRSSPGTRILVTSRAPLHLAGEQEFPVRPVEAGETCAMETSTLELGNEPSLTNVPTAWALAE